MLSQGIAKILSIVDLSNIFDNSKMHTNSKLLKISIDLKHSFHQQIMIIISEGMSKIFIFEVICLKSLISVNCFFLFCSYFFYMRSIFGSENLSILNSAIQIHPCLILHSNDQCLILSSVHHCS